MSVEINIKCPNCDGTNITFTISMKYKAVVEPTSWKGWNISDILEKTVSTYECDDCHYTGEANVILKTVV